MSTPQGYNPVGQSAPGLPRHDAPLPGHVPGQSTPPADMSWSAPPAGANWSPSVGYRDPGFPAWFGLWSGRVIMFGAIWLTVPLQMALYPIAGAVALAAGAIVYLAVGGSAIGHDATMNLCWDAALIALLPMMRLETRLETRVPVYRTLRHCLRLVFIAAGFFYLQVYEQQEPPAQAAIVAVIAAAIAHFFLRAALFRGMWEMLQSMLWLRKA